jgi:hypothetical protein
MRNLLKITLALTLALLPTWAFAATFHYRETVTFITFGDAAAGFSGCLMFQVASQGGKAGIDNSASGDTGATGYTGTAKRYVVDFNPANTPNYSPLVSIIASLLVPQNTVTVLINFVDDGPSQTTYPGCGGTSDQYAARKLGF